ncbi:MAG: hypothetical protein P1P74_09750 [Desulfuromonadales bacterium]|nr:hypothetical protein [Desulfuromonadales bacterium]MDT8423568.1 hypothetical protein [Desulfuromonadales bacterium]
MCHPVSMYIESQAVETTMASEQTIRIQRVLSEGGTEVRLYCHSPERQEKETAMAELSMSARPRALNRN